MARPETTRLTAPGYAPRQSSGPAAAVAAPINVRTNTGGVDALVQALGVAGNVVSQVNETRTNRSETAGRQDSALNQVDSARAARDAAYARGAGDILAERQTLEALSKWDARYQSEIAKGTPVAEVQQDFDSFMREELGHWLDDDRAKGIVASKLLPHIMKVTGAHVAAQTQERNEEAAATVGMSIHHDITNTGTTDFSAQFQKLAPMLGNSAAKRVVVETIVKTAAAAGRPDVILSALPEHITLPDGQKIVGPLKDANFADVIAAGIQQATSVQLRNNEEAREQARAPFIKKWQDDPVSFTDADYDRELALAGVEERFTQSELDTWRARRIAELEARERDRLANLQYAADPGMRLRYLRGTLKPDGKPWTDEEIANTFDRRVEQAFRYEPAAEGESENARLARVAAQLSAIEGYAYRPLAESLREAPPSDAEHYAASAEVYRQLSPGARKLYVPNDEKRAEYDRYLELTAGGRTKPEEASALLVNRQDALVKANIAAHEKEWGKRRDKLLSTEVDDGWFRGATRLGDLANSTQVSRLVYDGALSRIERGMAPETAIERATADVLATHYFIPGTRAGTSMLLPLQNGITHDEASETLKWFYGEFLPNELKIDPKTVRLSTWPGSPDNTTLVLIDEDHLPVDNKRFTLDYLVGVRRAQKATAGHSAAAARHETWRRNPEHFRALDTPNPDGYR